MLTRNYGSVETRDGSNKIRVDVRIPNKQIAGFCLASLGIVAYTAVLYRTAFFNGCREYMKSEYKALEEIGVVEK